MTDYITLESMTISTLFYLVALLWFMILRLHREFNAAMISARSHERIIYRELRSLHNRLNVLEIVDPSSPGLRRDDHASSFAPATEDASTARHEPR